MTIIAYIGMGEDVMDFLALVMMLLLIGAWVASCGVAFTAKGEHLHPISRILGKILLVSWLPTIIVIFLLVDDTLSL